MKLTKRQTLVLEFIRDYIGDNGMPPTRAEIVAHFGFASPNAAQAHLQALARRGAVTLTAGTSRGIRLTVAVRGDGNGAGSLPLVGRVAAGAPILAVENVEARHRVSPALFSPHADYLLRVRGDSMIDAGIRENDLLAVHATDEARPGQIVVARIEDEVTVKRFSRRGHQVTLAPANREFQPIVVDLRRHDLAIEGIAVGVIRQGGL